MGAPNLRADIWVGPYRRYTPKNQGSDQLEPWPKLG
jgi:hypothetical protein